MSTLVSIDGRITLPEAATISVFDRGFLYGDSVFETLRTYGGVPFALDEHFARLERSAERVLIELPVDKAQLGSELAELLERAGNAESYIRLMITRGVGDSLGLAPDLARAPSRVMIVAPLEVPPQSFYEHGIETVTYRAQRIADAAGASGAKLGNYLLSVLAMREARAAGAQEALIVDQEEHVLEGATSNVFAVSGGKLVTPPGDAAILLGITRARVLELARELDLSLELRALPLAELLGAEEAFITSTIREIVPVVAVDGRPVGDGRPGPVAGELLRRFREKARERPGSPGGSGRL